MTTRPIELLSRLSESVKNKIAAGTQGDGHGRRKRTKISAGDGSAADAAAAASSSSAAAANAKPSLRELRLAELKAKIQRNEAALEAAKRDLQAAKDEQVRAMEAIETLSTSLKHRENELKDQEKKVDAHAQ